MRTVSVNATESHTKPFPRRAEVQKPLSVPRCALAADFFLSGSLAPLCVVKDTVAAVVRFGAKDYAENGAKVTPRSPK